MGEISIRIIAAIRFSGQFGCAADPQTAYLRSFSLFLLYTTDNGGTKTARSFVITAKEQGGYKRCGHDFGIAHLALRIFEMVHSFQKIVTQAINCYNLGVQVFLLESSGFGTYNFTRRHMDFFRSSR